MLAKGRSPKGVAKGVERLLRGQLDGTSFEYISGELGCTEWILLQTAQVHPNSATFGATEGAVSLTKFVQAMGTESQSARVQLSALPAQ